MKPCLGGVWETYMKENRVFGPNARPVGPGEILKYRHVEIFIRRSQSYIFIECYDITPQYPVSRVMEFESGYLSFSLPLF